MLQAHPGAVRRRGPRHRPHGRGRVGARRAARLRRLLHRARRRPPGRTRPTTSPRSSPTPSIDGELAARHGHARPLPDHRHRRPRHDVERDRRWAARAHRAPRPARAAPGAARADRPRRRRAHPLRLAGEALHAAPARSRSPCATSPSSPATCCYLSYASANRDDEVFPDPIRLDVHARERGRATSPSASAATSASAPTSPGMEIRAIFRELLGRLDHVELAGEPTWTHAYFVEGPKSIPISYSMR